MIRMVTKSLGLWMLFLWIQRGVSAAGEKACGNKTGILGEAVELKCCYPGLMSDTFRVQWQLEWNFECVVNAHLPNENPAPQCERYKDRATLKDLLHLQLLNLSLEDSETYNCILQKKKDGKYQKIFHGRTRLEVAANNSTNDSEQPHTPKSFIQNDSQQQTHIVAAISCSAALVIITIIVLIWYKRSRYFRRAHTAPVRVDIS